MLTDITAARDAALAEIDAADSLDDVTSLTSRLTGKKGELAQLKTRLGSLETIDEKKAAGAAINEAMAAVDGSARCPSRRARRRGACRRVSSPSGSTSPSTSAKPTRGHAHLVTQAWERLEDVFIGLGFQVAEGPEVETDWHNFEALNMPVGHPARGEFDTLFVDHVPPGGEPGTTVLRTHTSPVQIRTMLEQEPPIYIVAPGRVFRRDTPDATHMPVFHQIEGLVVDRDITMADLAGTIEAFTKAFFGPGFSSRLRPSYFPFTEPSAEFDIQRPDGRGSSSAAAAWCTRTCCGRRPRPRGVERLRVRFRHRPDGGHAPRRRRHPRHVRPTTSDSWSSSDEDSAVLAQRVRRLRRPDERRRRPAPRRRADRRSASRSTRSTTVGETVDGVVTAASCASNNTPTRPRCSASTSTPATATSATCGAARSTWPTATSSRWPRSAPRCRTA